VTVCVNERRCIFGEVRNAEMAMNDAGKMIADNWDKLPQRFSNIETDEFVAMPNHLHGIIVIVGASLVGVLNGNNNRAGTEDRATIKVAPTLGGIIGAFKSITTNEYIRNVKTNNWPSFNKNMALPVFKWVN